MLGLLGQRTSFERRATPLSTGFTNRAGDALKMGIRTARLPIIIVAGQFIVAGMLSCHGAGFSRIDSVANVVVNFFPLVV